MNLALANTKKQLIENSVIQPIYDASYDLENDIFMIYSMPELKGIVETIFQKCIEDHRGIRMIHILSLEEYVTLQEGRITEVEVVEDKDIGFHVVDFFNNLGPYRDDMILVYSHTLNSTQTFLRQYCVGYQNVVCSTDIQTDGLGRKSNSWVSPVGCLMFSYKSAVQSGEHVGLLQYLEALVMCEAVKELNGVSGLDINIKWPNDVYVNKKTKICGIMCQSIYSNGCFDITSGIGINVSNRKPTTCLEYQIQEATGLTVHLSRAELLGKFIRIWNRLMPRFVREGFTPYLDRYYSQWLHTNQNVNVMKEEGGYDSVIIKGINENGCLIAIDSNGNKIELLSDGNSFNFLEGLVSKKI